MNEDRFPTKYALSKQSLDLLRSVRESLKEGNPRTDPAWETIFGKRVEDSEEEEEEEDDEEQEEEEEVQEVPGQNAEVHCPSTQFYFTQVERLPEDGPGRATEKLDVIECLCEGLERANGRLDPGQLESRDDQELRDVAVGLERRLTTNGVYNLCRSLTGLEDDQRIRYSDLFYTLVLLPKIIELEEPSRLLCSGVLECAEKFPDDVQRLIFVPLINVDLKDVTVVTSLVNGLDSQRNATLVSEYLQNAKELKSWHIPILQTLLSFRGDNPTKDQLIRLFLDKAAQYSKDKGFGKLVLSFMKVNAAFTEEQKSLLWEIINMNETLFKKLMENMLSKM